MDKEVSDSNVKFTWLIPDPLLPLFASMSSIFFSRRLLAVRYIRGRNLSA